jgi:catechol 2,3-dioxygenase-like lactoylglutathione lyase family enzyme
MSDNSPLISRVVTAVVPVSDQERALEFYVEKLGFEKRADFEYANGERWLEVAPPGATTQVTLAKERDGRRAGVDTGLAMSAPDVEATHAELKARGVDVDDELLREGDTPVEWAGAVLAGIPPMFLFRDPDGNASLIVQQL